MKTFIKIYFQVYLKKKVKSNTKNFLKIFQSKVLPEAQLISDATVEDQLRLVVDECVEEYKWVIFNLFQHKKDSKEEIPDFFLELLRSLTMERFEKKMEMMRSTENVEKFRKILENKIEAVQKEFTDASKETIERIRKFLNEKLYLDENPETTSMKTMERVELLRMLEFKQKKATENLKKEMVDRRMGLFAYFGTRIDNFLDSLTRFKKN